MTPHLAVTGSYAGYISLGTALSLPNKCASLPFCHDIPFRNAPRASFSQVYPLKLSPPPFATRGVAQAQSSTRSSPYSPETNASSGNAHNYGELGFARFLVVFLLLAKSRGRPDKKVQLLQFEPRLRISPSVFGIGSV